MISLKTTFLMAILCVGLIVFFLRAIAIVVNRSTPLLRTQIKPRQLPTDSALEPGDHFPFLRIETFGKHCLSVIFRSVEIRTADLRICKVRALKLR
jgi:hypothetical protein